MDLMDLIAPRLTEEQKIAAYEEATRLLNARIEKIMAERAATADPSLLTDLEKTHILCQDRTKTTVDIPMGKIHIDNIDVTKGETPFPFGNTNTQDK